MPDTFGSKGTTYFLDSKRHTFVSVVQSLRKEDTCFFRLGQLLSPKGLNQSRQISREEVFKGETARTDNEGAGGME